MLNMSAAIGLGLLSALRPNSAPYRDTAGLPGRAVGKPLALRVLWGAVIGTYLVRPAACGYVKWTPAATADEMQPVRPGHRDVPATLRTTMV